MLIERGANLLHYPLTAKIGEGGMGAVWRAADTTLNRDVAIKLLLQIFADSPERLARFEREARLPASLNHPNIAAIYGLHQAGDARFLAMELGIGDRSICLSSSDNQQIDLSPFPLSYPKTPFP